MARKNESKSMDRAMQIIRNEPSEITKHSTRQATPVHNPGPAIPNSLMKGEVEKTVRTIKNKEIRKAVLVDLKKTHLIEVPTTVKARKQIGTSSYDKTRQDIDRQIAKLAHNIRALLWEIHDHVEHKRMDKAAKWCGKVVASQAILDERLETKRKLMEMPALPAPDPILRKSRSFKKVKRYKRWSED